MAGAWQLSSSVLVLCMLAPAVIAQAARPAPSDSGSATCPLDFKLEDTESICASGGASGSYFSCCQLAMGRALSVYANSTGRLYLDPGDAATCTNEYVNNTLPELEYGRQWCPELNQNFLSLASTICQVKNVSDLTVLIDTAALLAACPNKQMVMAECDACGQQIVKLRDSSCMVAAQVFLASRDTSLLYWRRLTACIQHQFAVPIPPGLVVEASGSKSGSVVVSTVVIISVCAVLTVALMFVFLRIRRIQRHLLTMNDRMSTLQMEEGRRKKAATLKATVLSVATTTGVGHGGETNTSTNPTPTGGGPSGGQPPTGGGHQKPTDGGPSGGQAPTGGGPQKPTGGRPSTGGGSQKPTGGEPSDGQAQQTPEQALEELNSIIGLAEVKTFIRALHAQIHMNKIRKRIRLPEMDMGSLHMIFTGNPGTGKTTVARIVANLLHSLGLLNKGHLVEADRSTLVGSYIGETALKTKEVFESALGGVLFVDEAYTLTPKTSGYSEYGEEALATIMKMMEDHRDELVVIFAGYREDMDRMLATNPGVGSRFPKQIEFEDYNAEELMSIAKGMLQKQRLDLTQKAEKALSLELNALASRPSERKKESGNGRAVRNIIEQAKRNQSLRLASASGSKTTEELQTLVEEDFAGARGGPGGASSHKETPEQVLAKLDALVGLKGIKSFVKELQAQILMNGHRIAAGLPVIEMGALHMIFTGNPGTGKTIVARIIAELLRALGLLRLGHLIECDRSTLTAGYTGQSAIKTREVIRTALGGVLFVDEAYTLSKGSFGDEVLETLLKGMEDNRDDLVVILVGYEADMAVMMSSNPGIRSRFPTVLHFDDYNTEELLTIFCKMLEKEGFILSPNAHKQLLQQLADMASLPKEEKRGSGNARAIRNMVEDAKRKQAVRLSQDTTKRTPKDLQTLEEVDLQT